MLSQSQPMQQDYYSYPRPEVQALVPHWCQNILDIGCGAGALGEGLKARQPCRVTGVEIIEGAAQVAAQKLDKVWVGTIETNLPLLAGGSFDCIIMADVLEHLVEPQTVLKGLAPVLTDNGVIVVSLPNIRHWTIIRDLLEGRFDYQDAGILDRTHLRFFTLRSAASMLIQSGYHVSFVQGIVMPGFEMPPGFDQAIKPFGIDTTSLADESKVYQFLFTAKKHI